MKALKSIYQKKGYPVRCLINSLISGLFILLLLSACSGPKPHISDKPSSQRFRNVTRLFISEKLFVTQAGFLRGNQDALSDLVVLNQVKNELYILVNRGEKGFSKKNIGKWIQENKERINFFVSADLDRDGGDDLILILGDRKNLKTRILFNNKKGYFYPKKNQGNHSLTSGIEKVIPIDIDGDGDKDLFYFGSNIKKSNKNSYQTMIWINKGDGRLENLTALLMPKLPIGIRDASFADYDNDGVVDIFLVYEKGQNRILLNNGLGKFSDHTSSRLPRIVDDSMHADWADFDQDGDNDLLVVNRSIQKIFRGYPGETSYFLENMGGGNFKKRAHKILPRLPSIKAYLLDGNTDTRPDALILTVRGVYYFQGRRGKWKFSDETEKRLPRFRQFNQMTFGNINKDQFLDLFGWSKNSSRLWLNRFD
ncbi:MAG: VCBS repeat-containing protein [Nitrospinota bacterium]|nr:VCBS repeat-containing protein [Nitrospinota bacterium]